MDLKENMRDGLFVVESAPTDTAVVLFHGYGADCYDLCSLSQSIKTNKDVTWIFPNGTQSVMGAGRAWFDILENKEALFQITEDEEAMENLASLPRPQVIDATKQLQGFYENLRSEFKTLYIGGFSQGAMISTSLTMEAQNKPEALIVLSGIILNKTLWEERMGEQKIPFFQSHGEHDSVLPFSGAQRLEKFFLDAKWNGHLRAFNGGHEIPYEIIKELSDFINDRLKES